MRLRMTERVMWVTQTEMFDVWHDDKMWRADRPYGGRDPETCARSELAWLEANTYRGTEVCRLVKRTYVDEVVHPEASPNPNQPQESTP